MPLRARATHPPLHQNDGPLHQNISPADCGWLSKYEPYYDQFSPCGVSFHLGLGLGMWGTLAKSHHGTYPRRLLSRAILSLLQLARQPITRPCPAASALSYLLAVPICPLPSPGGGAIPCAVDIASEVGVLFMTYTLPPLCLLMSYIGHCQVRMMSQTSCECGWKPKKSGNSTRAQTAHLRVCRLREAKVAGSLLKRRAADITADDGGDGLTAIEPARKTPRHSVR